MGETVTAEQVKDAISRLEQIQQRLRERTRELEQQAAVAREHHRNLVGVNQTTADAILRIQHAQMVQNYLHDLGAGMLDILALAHFYKSVKTGEIVGEDGVTDLVLGLNTYHEAIKDLEDLLAIGLGSAVAPGVEPGPSVSGELAGQLSDIVSNETLKKLQTLKSQLSEAAAALRTLQTQLKSCKTALEVVDKVDHNALLMVGRLVENASEAEKAIRAEQLAHQQACFNAEQDVLGPAWFGASEAVVARDDARALLADVTRQKADLIAAATVLGVDTRVPTSTGPPLDLADVGGLRPTLTGDDLLASSGAQDTSLDAVEVAERDALRGRIDSAEDPLRAIYAEIERLTTRLRFAEPRTGVADASAKINELRSQIADLNEEQRVLRLEAASLRDSRWSISGVVFAGADDDEIRNAQREHLDKSIEIAQIEARILEIETDRAAAASAEDAEWRTVERLRWLESLAGEYDAANVSLAQSASRTQKNRKFMIALGGVFGAIAVTVGALTLTGDEGDDTPSEQVAASESATGQPNTEGGQGTSEAVAATGFPSILLAFGASPEDWPAGWTLDPQGGLTFSIVGADGQLRPATDIERVQAVLAVLTGPLATAAFGNTSYGCGTVTDEYRVTCPLGAGAVEAGEYVVVVVEHAGGVGEGSGRFTYGLAFADDADEGDNLVSMPPFDADFFQGTESFYRLTIGAAGERYAWADGTVDGIPGHPRASSAAVVEWGSSLVWFIPREELGPGPLRYRTTAFADDGPVGRVPEPATSGGDVSGSGVDELLDVVATAVTFDDVDALPPDVDAPVPRVEIEGPPGDHIAAVLVAEFVDRVNAGIAAGDDIVALTISPEVLVGSSDACRDEMATTVALAESIELAPGDRPPSIPANAPIIASVGTITYETGVVPWGPLLASASDGKLYPLLASCLQDAQPS